MNYSVRLSTLKYGWDMSGFYYRSTDVGQTFHRQFDARPIPSHSRPGTTESINGGTVSKDFGDIVFKAEGVYTPWP